MELDSWIDILDNLKFTESSIKILKVVSYTGKTCLWTLPLLQGLFVLF